jgi:hypothetical protein
MPIVVRELVIRARVEEVAGSSGGNGATRPPASGLAEAELERVVALCVEQVLNTLERRKER